MWEKEIPTIFRKIGIGATKDRNEVVLEGLDGTFGKVNAVVARQSNLVIELFGFDGGNECLGNFVVEAEEASLQSAVAKLVLAFPKASTRTWDFCDLIGIALIKLLS